MHSLGVRVRRDALLENLTDRTSETDLRTVSGRKSELRGGTKHNGHIYDVTGQPDSTDACSSTNSTVPVLIPLSFTASTHPGVPTKRLGDHSPTNTKNPTKMNVSAKSNNRSALDPFRTILGTIAAAKDADTLVQVANLAGIRFDARLSERDNFTHGMRIRALLPRIQSAYDGLIETDQLIAANALLSALVQLRPEVAETAGAALTKIGWSASGSQLTVADAGIREMFFPKGTQWDAFVVLKGVLAEARSDVLIVDAYCSGDIFQMIVPHGGLTVRMLCSKNAEALAVEARRYVDQHPEVKIEIRKTKDFHDRFVVLDHEVCVHVGASLKDAGKAAFMISRIEDETNRVALLDSAKRTWNTATSVPS